jgi:outer membrane protein
MLQKPIKFTAMKKFVTFLGLFLLMFGINAQSKIGYVDSEYILNQIPEFKQAQEELEKLSQEWQKQLEKKYAEIDQLYRNYQAEHVLLTEDMRRKREEEITRKEKEAKEFQKAKFGPDGELFKKRQELVQPIQDKIYNAIKDIASVDRLDIVFDKSSGATILYVNPKNDISDKVLKKLGVEVKDNN